METEAQKFWNEEFFLWFRDVAYRYGEIPDCPYPFYEIRLRHVLDAVRDITPGQVLDVGCGGGHVLAELLNLGWRGEGCDFAPNMLGFAQQRLTALGHAAVAVREAFATQLDGYADESFDLVLCLGPVEYLDQTEAEAAYTGARRVLRPGGWFICSHINRLFDIFTLDEFTVALISDILMETGMLTASESMQLKPLLGNRLGLDRLDSTKSASIRTRVPNRPDNPLTISTELERHGFKLKDLIFYRFYCAPPFVYQSWPELTKRTVEFERLLAHDWRGNFLASSFLTISRRQGRSR